MAEYIEKPDMQYILHIKSDKKVEKRLIDYCLESVVDVFEDTGLTADVQPVKWISVNDRLPDENQKCLVYRDINADLKITTGIWHSDMKEFYGLRHGTRLKDTIAWMPLLESPKDGDIND